MAQFVSDCMRTMRLAVARRNVNDPDSSDTVFLQYINDFINLTMTDDVKVFEQFGTMQFDIDGTHEDGVYTFNDVGATDQFSNISMEAFITRKYAPICDDDEDDDDDDEEDSEEDTPLYLSENSSISWNQLWIFQDPGQFYSRWGILNTEILVKGYPSEMLYYGTEMVFRTIPDEAYTVQIFGYKIVPTFTSVGDPQIPFDWWMRYIAYGAAMNYARDFRFEDSKIAQLEKAFAHERKLLLTRTHNQIKISRAQPRF